MVPTYCHPLPVSVALISSRDKADARGRWSLTMMSISLKAARSDMVLYTHSSSRDLSSAEVSATTSCHNPSQKLLRWWKFRGREGLKIYVRYWRDSTSRNCNALERSITLGESGFVVMHCKTKCRGSWTKWSAAATTGFLCGSWSDFIFISINWWPEKVNS